MKKMLAILLAAALALSLCAVLADGSEDMAIDLSEYFSKRDLSGGWDVDGAQTIRLDGQTAVSITEAGTYVLSGAMNGSVTVSVGDSDKVQLVLDGVEITADGAAIHVENADKTFITLAAGSQNTLTAAGFEEGSEIDAAIFSRDDITLNGAGSLTIVSAGHGVVGKDDLKITGGAYDITAEGRGIDANDSIRIYDGQITVVSGKDAIRAKSDEADKGYLLVAGGVFRLTAGGGAANGETHTEDMRMGFRGGWGQTAADSADTASTKGLKASGKIYILGGDFTIDAADDAVHTDGDATVYGGTLTLRSGDDGMHADSALTIESGAITIAQSYEGLEAAAVTINGGDISVTASDDGINSSGGKDQSGWGRNDMFASDGSSIAINGGNVHVNASGDGIDANGDLYVTGGSVVVSGPTNSGNGALDYNGTAAITGGTVIAAGASGMAEIFGASSTQVAFMVNLNGGAGEITVADAQGSVLLSGTVEKSFQCVVISSPDLAVGETYTVSSGNATAQVTPSAIVSGGGMGGFGGGRNGFGGGMGGFGGGRNGFGGNMNGQMPDGTDMPQMPDDMDMPQMPDNMDMPQMPDNMGMPQMPDGGRQPGGGFHR